MGIRSSLKTARWAISRRKTKNLSAILALTLGVTLMVGINITTDTLGKSFLTGLLVGEGEVDIKVSSGSLGYLSARDEANISSLIPDALGITPELRTVIPAQLGTQFEPKVELAGVQADYPSVFGDFIEWKSQEKMDLNQYLVDNTSVIISSDLAHDFGLTQEDSLPLTVRVELDNTSLQLVPNATDQLVPTPVTLEQKFNFSITGIYDADKPGMGPFYPDMVMSLEGVQQWVSLGLYPHNTDIIGTYLISLKTDHFSEDIDETYLQEKFDEFVEKIPSVMIGGGEVKVYAAEAPRLVFYDFIDLFFTILSSIFNALGMMIVLTGILLITNIQLMSVEDREFQTGVLRAVGEKRRGIFLSISFETVFQGILGGILGLIGGMIFGTVVAMYLGSLFGTGELSIQPVVNESVISFSVFFGVFIGILTGILPALRASRVNIVEALRGIKISFKQRSGRNLIALGIISTVLGVYFLLINGVFNTNLDYIWVKEGWNELTEWINILIGLGLLSTGLAIILSRYIDRKLLVNLTAFVLWFMPTFMFVFAFGEGWIESFSGSGFQVIIVAIVEIIIGSVILVGVNLSPLMRTLRRILIKIRGFKGVAQVAPALISSHKTRSSLTFAIFAIVLTLNVLVASLVASNVQTTIGQSESDSRGIDLVVNLNKPEKLLNDTSYTQELYKLDSSITDVIGFKTYESDPTAFTRFVALKNPNDPLSGFNPQDDLIPFGFTELRSNQIRGEATSAEDPNWRFDFYLDSFPGDLQRSNSLDISDANQLDLSKQAWDTFFEPGYTMTTYNRSLGFNFDLNSDQNQGGGGFGGGNVDIDKLEVLTDANGTTITRPIVFTDSPIIPYGLEVWIPMNTTTIGNTTFNNYQPFVVGGSFDFERVGGFPLSRISFGGGGEGGFSDFGSILGSLYFPERWSQYTNFFGKANGDTANSRGPNQFDAYLVKTDYELDDPKIDELARTIEDYTNSESGYRQLANDDFMLATTTTIYSKISDNLEIMNQFTAFLQIYVNFGLVIGAIGMAVISIRNVSERKREIGMMRAIGFPRLQVMLAALLELVVLGIIGLFIGVVNGLVMNYGFAQIQGSQVAIPWDTILTYLTFITVVALGAGAIPGWVASRIPAAEALRYVG